MCLALAAIVLILISVFNDAAPDWVLTSGMACMAVAVILNMIQLCRLKKNR
jgi:hypothetical protein